MMTTTTIRSTRFGEIHFTTEDVVTIIDGLLGFPHCTQYLILAHKEGSAFRGPVSGVLSGRAYTLCP
jgi:hypothetical protein